MRQRWRYNATDRAQYYSLDSAGWQYAGGATPVCTSVEYMEDELNDVKSLGKSLDDTGGPLEHVKVSMSVQDWTTYYSSNALSGFPGMADVYLPSISGLSNGLLDSPVAKTALNYLKGVANGSWDTPGKTGAQIAADMRVVDPDWTVSTDMDQLGTTAISRVSPTNPSVDVATAVAELISERKFFALPGTNNSLSGEWLNWSLGISPTIAFVTDMRDTMEKSESLFKQYERDAGKLVRRRYQFEPEITTGRATYTGVMGLGNPSGLNSSITGASGTVVCTYKKTKKSWFSGAFTYALPEKGWRRTLAELDQVYGIVPGIDTAWELLPFSFVADYFANMGDVLKNVNMFSTDGLVMPYGYVMQRTERTWEFQGNMTLKPTGRTSSMSYGNGFKIHVVTKRRLPANPFGFGLKSVDLTPRQWSILGALGISLVR